MNDPKLSEQKERVGGDLQKSIDHSIIVAMTDGLSSSSVLGTLLNTAGEIVAGFAGFAPASPIIKPRLGNRRLITGRYNEQQ